MNILDRVLSRFGYLNKKGLAPYLSSAGGYGSLMSALSGKDVDPSTAMSAYNGWVFACASVIGEEIAKTKFRLFQVDKKSNQEELFEHELLDQLNRPNNYQTGWEMKFLLGVHLVIVGKAYLYLQGVKDRNSKPMGLYPLLPQYLKPIMGDTVENLIKGYEYTLRSDKKQIYTTDQVLCVRYPSPTKLFDGMGVVGGIPGWIDSDNFATEFNRKFLEPACNSSNFLAI
jgi:phage portal protein BeeE